MITINDYVIDAFLTETHTLNSEVTSYPVEEGSDVSDHVRAQPIQVDVEGIVSDTPIGKAAVVRAGVQALIEEGLTEPTTPSGDALAELEKIYNARQPVTISTSIRLYESMVMQSLEIPRDSSTGAALRFRATFVKVVIVTNDRVRVRVAVPRGSSKKKLGNKSAGVFAGKPMYRCLEDVEKWIKYEDIAAARRTNAEASPAVWTDYKESPGGSYRSHVSLCLRKERVGYDSKADGGRGLFLRADGKTPLSQEELDDMNDELRKQADVEYGPGMKGPALDLKSNKYVKYVDRPSPPGNLPLVGDIPADDPWWADKGGKPR